MTWIKICGTTNLEDALLSVEAGADALGFVFYRHSPRYIHPEQACEIIEQLPRNIEKVGVFVGHSVSRATLHQARLTAIQVHGQPSTSRRMLDDVSKISKKVFIVLPADQVFRGRLGGFRWRSEAKDKVSAVVLDSRTPDKPGGTGISFDWKKAVPILATLREDFKFVIAGGLNPENVAEAIRILDPWGVDVVSGVEASPGKKDPEKVRAFISAVRQADKKK
ncbi:MAG: phosphoribosylanthranilate isomerase [Terriglobales bacterium]